MLSCLFLTSYFPTKPTLVCSKKWPSVKITESAPFPLNKLVVCGFTGQKWKNKRLVCVPRTFCQSRITSVCWYYKVEIVCYLKSAHHCSAAEKNYGFFYRSKCWSTTTFILSYLVFLFSQNWEFFPYINRVYSLYSVQLYYHNSRFNLPSQPTLTLTLLPTPPLPFTVPWHAPLLASWNRSDSMAYNSSHKSHILCPLILSKCNRILLSKWKWKMKSEKWSLKMKSKMIWIALSLSR